MSSPSVSPIEKIVSDIFSFADFDSEEVRLNDDLESNQWWMNQYWINLQQNDRLWQDSLQLDEFNREETQWYLSQENRALSLEVREQRNETDDINKQLTDILFITTQQNFSNKKK